MTIASEGSHEAVAVGGSDQWGTSGQGNEQLVLKFRIVSGPDKGAYVTWFATYTKNTYERIMESLRHCGWKGDDISKLGKLGVKVEIVVSHDDYDPEKIRARVDWVNPLGGGRIKLQNPMNDGEIRKFAARMKAHAKLAPEVETEVYVEAASAEPEAAERTPPEDQSLPYEDERSPPPIHGDDDDGIPF